MLSFSLQPHAYASIFYIFLFLWYLLHPFFFSWMSFHFFPAWHLTLGHEWMNPWPLQAINPRPWTQKKLKKKAPDQDETENRRSNTAHRSVFTYLDGGYSNAALVWWLEVDDTALGLLVCCRWLILDGGLGPMERRVRRRRRVCSTVWVRKSGTLSRSTLGLIKLK